MAAVLSRQVAMDSPPPSSAMPERTRAALERAAALAERRRKETSHEQAEPRAHTSPSPPHRDNMIESRSPPVAPLSPRREAPAPPTAEPVIQSTSIPALVVVEQQQDVVSAPVVPEAVVDPPAAAAAAPAGVAPPAARAKFSPGDVVLAVWKEDGVRLLSRLCCGTCCAPL